MKIVGGACSPRKGKTTAYALEESLKAALLVWDMVVVSDGPPNLPFRRHGLEQPSRRGGRRHLRVANRPQPGEAGG